MLTHVITRAKKITTFALFAAVIAFGGRAVLAGDQAAGTDTGGYAAVYTDEGSIDRNLGTGGAEARATNPVPAPSGVDNVRSIYTTPIDPGSGGFASVYGDEGSLDSALDAPAPVMDNFPNMEQASAPVAIDTMKNVITTPHDAGSGGYANVYQDEDGTEN